MPADLTILEVDPADEDLLARWHAVHAASQRHGRAETATVWMLPEVSAMLREPTERSWRAPYVALRGEEVVGTGFLHTSLCDNLDAAEVTVDTRPDLRRQGIGTAVLAHLEAVCRARGRTVLQAELSWPFAGPTRGEDSGDLAFAVHHGFALGLVDVQRRLRLPVAGAVLDRLAAAAAPHHAAYDVRAWVGPVPDDLVDGWAALSGLLMTEAPTGDIDREPEALDAAGVREGEVLLAAQGRTKHNAVALNDGEVVACTDLVTTVHEPGRAYQWGTLVREDHRGHRLGTALKVANLRLLQAQRPDITTVQTWNAEVNHHMVGVNKALGFEPVERLGELQKKL